MNIGESLQSFASRTGVSVENAKKWHVQFCAIDPNGNSIDHVTIAGGRCLGLTSADIRAIGR